MKTLFQTTKLYLLGSICFAALGVHPGQITAQEIRYAGLPNIPLGNAELAQEEDMLIVSNIGSSGEDGVAIRTGESEFLCVEVDLADPQIPVGASFLTTAFGEYQGQSDAELGTLHVTRARDGFELSATFPTTSSSQTITIYNEDQVVAVLDDALPPVITIEPPATQATVDPHAHPEPRRLTFLFEVDDPLEATWDDDGVLRSVIGTRIVFEPIPTVERGVLTHLHVMAAGMPSFNILGELLGVFGRPHSAVGDVHLEGIRRGEAVQVSNIITRGGVAIKLDEAETFLVELEPTVPAEPGAILEIGARGQVDGTPNQPLGLLKVMDVGGRVELVPDYSAIGSQTQRLEVYNRGEPVAVLPGVSDAVIQVDEWPSGYGKGAPSRPSFPLPPLPCFIPIWPDEISILINGQQFIGDELRILAEDGAPLDFLSEFSLVALGIPDLILTGERADAGFGGQEVIFSGVPFRSLGNAVLEVEEEKLIISNIGDSGNDGAAIDLGEAGFGLAFYDGFDVQSFETGAAVTAAAYGDVDGEPNQPISAITFRDAGEEAEVLVDFSPLGTRPSLVEVFQDNDLVLRANLSDNIVARLPGPIIPCEIIDPIWPMPPCLSCPPDDIIITAIIDFPEPQEIIVPGAGAVRGTRIMVTAGDPSPQPSINLVSELQILPQGMESFALIGAAVGAFHNPHLALGDARIRAFDGGKQFEVFDIGTSGEDGVQIDLKRAPRFHAGLGGLESMGQGSVLTLQARGSLGGVPDQSLGVLSVEDVGGAFEVMADYAALGSDTHLLEVYEQGQLVARFPGRTGVVARVPELPNGCGKVPPIPRPLPCYLLNFADVVQFTVPGVQGKNTADVIVEGDELRVLADGASEEVDFLSSFSIQAAGIPMIGITDETTAAVVDIGLEKPAGWSLSSLPVALPDGTVLDDVFDTFISAFTFDQEAGYVPTNDPVATEGFWLNLNSAEEALLTGAPIGPYTKSLPAGWSLIGGLTGGPAAVSTTPDDALAALFRFVPDEGYEPTETIPHGEAAWINCTEACQVNVTPAGDEAAPSAASSKTLAAAREAVFTAIGEPLEDFVSRSRVALGTAKTSEVTPYPPALPQYTTGLRLLTGEAALYRDVRRGRGTLERWVLEVDPNGNAAGSRTTRLTWQAEALKAVADVPWTLRAGRDGTGAILIQDMRKTTSLTLSGTEVQTLTVSAELTDTGEGDVPTQFALLANYPNPFNPTTTIGYELPEAAHVAIRVYNSLGQQVEVLVNDAVEAGRHEVVWQGRDASGRTVPSGVYFYRMEAGDFVQTHRLVLVK